MRHKKARPPRACMAGGGRSKQLVGVGVGWGGGEPGRFSFVCPGHSGRRSPPSKTSRPPPPAADGLGTIRSGGHGVGARI